LKRIIYEGFNWLDQIISTPPLLAIKGKNSKHTIAKQTIIYIFGVIDGLVNNVTYVV